MNRIKVKPYGEPVESAGRPDDVVAAESWVRYRSRNDSEIVDRLFGQLRSHVTCSSCGHESTTFDAYSSLSLPIPVSMKKVVTVKLFPLPLGTPPVEVQLRMSLSACVSDLIKEILMRFYNEDASTAAAAATSSAPSPAGANAGASRQFHVCQAYAHGNRIFKTLQLNDPVIEAVRYDQLLIYETLPGTKVPSSSYIKYGETSPAETQQEIVYPYRACDVLNGFQSTDFYGRPLLKIIGLPQRISISSTQTNSNIHLQIATVMKRFILQDSKFSSFFVSPLADEYIPYKLFICNIYGTDIKREILIDDSPFVVSENESILVKWSNGIVNSVHWNVDALTIQEAPQSKEEENSKQPLTLQRCFEKYSERERLADTETLYCSNCKQHCVPYKKMDLWSTPQILIVQLKRFQYTPGSYFVHREKISDLVDFPVEGLDLSAFVKGTSDASSASDPPIYDLYAVSEHMGGLGGGHYTAKCQNPKDKKWYANCIAFSGFIRFIINYLSNKNY
jgi:hypothetical protein